MSSSIDDSCKAVCKAMGLISKQMRILNKCFSSDLDFLKEYEFEINQTLLKTLYSVQEIQNDLMKIGTKILSSISGDEKNSRKENSTDYITISIKEYEYLKAVNYEYINQNKDTSDTYSLFSREYIKRDNLLQNARTEEGNRGKP